MRNLMLLSVIGLIVALGVGVTACGSDDHDGNGTEADGNGTEADFELSVGVLTSLTGDLSQFGPPAQKAATLAVEQANEAIEAAGAAISVNPLEVGDDESRPQPAQSAARQLISDGVSCIVGATGSAQTIPVGQAIAARQQVPLISPASTSPEITELDDDGFVFRTVASDTLQGQVLADAVGEAFGTDATISVAGRNDAYGEGIVRQFSDAFEAAGGTIAGPVLYDPEAPSYDSEAAEIVAGNPDGFVIIDFEEPYNQVGAALARSGDFDASNMFTADGLAFLEIPDTIPDAALDEARGTRPATPDDTDAAEAFAALYSAAPGVEYGSNYEAQTFDGTILCILAAVAAGSDDPTAIRDRIQDVASGPGTKYDYTQLADAIAALQAGDEIDFEGVSGPLDLDDNGDPEIAYYEVWRYQDGKLTTMDTVEMDARE